MKNLTADEVRSGWPDGRVAEMLDAAQTHLLEDQPEEAVAIWQQLISEGGEAADWGHLEFADYFLSSEQERGARTELVTLVVGRRATGVQWLSTAELLEDRGQLEEALVWYSAAAGALPAVEPAALDEPPIGGMAHQVDDWTEELRAGRRRVRWGLGIPLDERDLLAPLGQAEAEEKVRGLSRLLSYPQVIDGRLQLRSRRDLDRLRRLDPGIPARFVDIYYQFAERELRNHGSGRVVVLPRLFDVLSPWAQAAFGARTMAELVSVTSRCDVGEAIEWPPGRNQGCWCGSGVKYKKCCGWPPD
ncbi:SEC-C domain-containing protein [Kribbella sp. CA-294648]|uniref:SEC-C domain-containing protein n=1 Tax=Kribbella sp. CA-294648 TaxID=3239948 RepID=UPI003D8EC3EB